MSAGLVRVVYFGFCPSLSSEATATETFGETEDVLSLPSLFVPQGCSDDDEREETTGLLPVPTVRPVWGFCYRRGSGVI